jgi:hypothetical protein
MEARWHVELTGVELTGGTELAAPVEKTTAGPVEKAATGPCTREDRDGWEAQWRGREDGLPCSSAEEMPTGGAKPR